MITKVKVVFQNSYIFLFNSLLNKPFSVLSLFGLIQLLIFLNSIQKYTEELIQSFRDKVVTNY